MYSAPKLVRQSVIQRHMCNTLPETLLPLSKRHLPIYISLTILISSLPFVIHWQLHRHQELRCFYTSLSHSPFLTLPPLYPPSLPLCAFALRPFSLSTFCLPLLPPSSPALPLSLLPLSSLSLSFPILSFLFLPLCFFLFPPLSLSPSLFFSFSLSF